MYYICNIIVLNKLRQCLFMVFPLDEYYHVLVTPLPGFGKRITRPW